MQASFAWAMVILETGHSSAVLGPRLANRQSAFGQHLAGASTRELASLWAIHPGTVSDYLKRRGIAGPGDRP